MAQVSWRTSEGLVARVRLQADHLGLSMNEYLTRVLETATDPSYSLDPADQVRERLRLSGLLATPAELFPADDAGPDPADFAAARKRAGSGTALSELIVTDR